MCNSCVDSEITHTYLKTILEIATRTIETNKKGSLEHSMLAALYRIEALANDCLKEYGNVNLNNKLENNL